MQFTNKEQIKDSDGLAAYYGKTDDRATVEAQGSETIHNYRMENDPEYAAQVRFNAMTSNQALEDQSLIMALVGSGVKPLAGYAMPVTHIPSRVVNAVANKDPKRLFGVPSKEQVRSAFVNDPGARDKLLWKGTGNSVKLDMVGYNE